MSNKDEKIKQLEDEIIAARKTIASLTKSVEELSRKVGMYHAPIYIQPYRYNYPYWTYTVGDVTYTSTVGTGTFTADQYRNTYRSGGTTTNTTNVFLNEGEQVIKRDDDDGDAGVRAAV